MDKSQLRAAIKARLAALDEKHISESDRAISERLFALPELQSARRVFAYCSIGREVDTRVLLSLLLRRGTPVALPRTQPEGRMSFAFFSSLSELIAGTFGIPEPSASLPSAIPGKADLVLVPALCYDERGYRLGHGGGYYDRFLASCQAPTAGLCREALLQSALPREAHDIPVSVLITENKTARPLRVSQEQTLPISLLSQP